MSRSLSRSTSIGRAGATGMLDSEELPGKPIIQYSVKPGGNSASDGCESLARFRVQIGTTRAIAIARVEGRVGSEEKREEEIDRRFDEATPKPKPQISNSRRSISSSWREISLGCRGRDWEITNLISLAGLDERSSLMNPACLGIFGERCRENKT